MPPRFGQSLRRSYIEPRAIKNLAGSNSDRSCVPQQMAQADLGCPYSVKKLSTEHTDPGVGKALASLQAKPACLQREVTSDVVRRIGHQNDVCLVNTGTKPRKIESSPDISVDDHERALAQQPERASDAARCFHRAIRLPGILYVHPEGFSRPEMLLYSLSKVGHVNHQLSETCSAQPRYVSFDQRLPIHLQQWLRKKSGQRQHALSTARRQNHCFHYFALCTGQPVDVSVRTLHALA